MKLHLTSKYFPEQRAKGFVGWSSEVAYENMFADYRPDSNGVSETLGTVFSVFFPAVTGITAGANMSG